MIEKVDKIWMDGQLVDWDDANVHILSHTLHYGLGAFEGIRCYRQYDGRSAVFRLEEHIDRLLQSALVAGIPIMWTQDQVCQACLETIRINKLDECYIRPLLFIGSGDMGLYVKDNPTHLSIVVWRWGTYLGEEGLKNGVRAKVSSYARPGVNSVMTKGKIVGHYVNSILAKREVVAAGYQEAVMLDSQGYVAEASGENLFIVKKNQIYTPPLGCSILPGITRDAILNISQDLGIPVTERLISRDEIYIADEAFFTGTAAEVTPLRELDNRQIGAGVRGPITEQIQARFFEVVHGRVEQYRKWLTYV